MATIRRPPYNSPEYDTITFAGFQFGAVMFFVALIAWMKAENVYNVRLQATGTRAAAKILEVHNTSYEESSGTRRARLVLQVEPASSEPFRAEAVAYVGVGDARVVFPVGAHIEVRYDPSDRRRVALMPVEQTEDETHRAAEELQPEERLKRLENLRAKGLVTEEEYAEKRQRILGRL